MLIAADRANLCSCFKGRPVTEADRDPKVPYPPRGADKLANLNTIKYNSVYVLIILYYKSKREHEPPVPSPFHSVSAHPDVTSSKHVGTKEAPRQVN